MTDSSLAPHQLSEAAPVVLDHVGPLREVLGQLARLVDQLDDTAYNTKPVTTYGGSIGGHVRHCLDHVSALLCGTHGDLIDYEARERGTDIETNPVSACSELQRLDTALAELPEDVGQLEVTTSILLTPSGPALKAPSSVARELAFVLSHTIHHNAMIGGMAKALGSDVPADFGMAPGTLEHQRKRQAQA
ncbi:DinB family protein [Algisphaera agarilytica]|uniref:Putative damage-inducible protein DinB n=1 Tax=Algisphaera agarilytica TaxID=1385975 RepID=A0A7X0H8W4_9BACT|nr:DinB family protein [Algisphaera agarilytica]MBB6431293.1 putative damage-inducible protein DinB [Algisphaera agarilytica]